MDDKLKEALLSTFKQFDNDNFYEDFDEFISKEELEEFSNSNKKKKERYKVITSY